MGADFLAPKSGHWRKKQPALGPVYSPYPQILFCRGKIFFSIKPSMTNHVNSRLVDGKLSASCVHTNFSLFYLGIFSLRIFCLFRFLLKLSKEYLLLFCNNPMKVWIRFDMSSKLSLLCDTNSEKTFCNSLIWKEPSKNVSIAWYKLCGNV